MHSRKSSMQSIRSPVTPRPHSASDRGHELSFPGDLGGVEHGLGSLADELAQEEWDEYDEADGATHFRSDPSADHVNASNPPYPPYSVGPSPRPASVRDPTGPVSNGADAYAGRCLPSKVDIAIPISLEEQISALESLARLDSGQRKSETKGDFGVLVEQLQDLGSQANLESQATR